MANIDINENVINLDSQRLTHNITKKYQPNSKGVDTLYHMLINYTINGDAYEQQYFVHENELDTMTEEELLRDYLIKTIHNRLASDYIGLKKVDDEDIDEDSINDEYYEKIHVIFFGEDKIFEYEFDEMLDKNIEGFKERVEKVFLRQIEILINNYFK